ncbi:MAG TPA: ABC transporter substrate-binding protein, partial [Candidatus Binatus sp.]|nr:ABC transporter substrate-binding protein [Candidatus Binatus sp.]
MNLRRILVSVAALLFEVIALNSAMAAAAPLPKATEEMLKKLKLEPAIMANLDKELDPPKAWLDGARKEGKLRIYSTFDPGQADVLAKPFKERYPFINIEYNRASHEDRAVRTLVAYKNKKILTDIITGLGGSYFMYKEVGALDDLRSIPNLKNNSPETVDTEGLWVGMHMRYWCMAYNTRNLKKEDMPKRWDDVLTNAKFRNGNLAIGNRPQLWALSLWKANGEKWSKDFLTKLFNEVKPQLRRE